MNAATRHGAPTGLTAAEAAAALALHGRNEIRRAPVRPAWRVFAAQFRSVLVVVLLVAAALSFVLQEVADAIAIVAIVLVNAGVGYLQESKAERALLALRAMTAPRARVRRDGHAVVIPAAEVVPDDLLLLEAGDMVAADGMLLEAADLTLNEAPLTGESLPVRKDIEPAADDAPLAERRNQVFLGTAVSTGTGAAFVQRTGMSTELGKIATLLESAEETATPLQRRLAEVARVLLLAALGVVALVGAVGLLRGLAWADVLLSSASLAVAAVPEGLPAIVTIALALGVQRLAGRNVLVRRLPSVETLGCVTVICTDKTGTLTEGKMAVRELWGEDHHRLLDVAAACCDAELGGPGLPPSGDPTEIAILERAALDGIQKTAIEAANPRVSARPFDSERKRMSILRADGTLYVKGAVDVLLPLCVSPPDRALEENHRMAERGLRVLAAAVGRGDVEADLTLIGLIGMADPPRAESVAAIADARRAGIRSVMITGDHPVTARAIATELGLLRPGDEVGEFVYARATAEDKLRVVRSAKAKGDVVAMTGDGVNDAPALREAHIGVAMGRTGTEVTREAADMVLTDDNYASIVEAVREGRGIYENIRKTLVYLIAGNAAELLFVLATALLGLPLPLLPLQLLWLNLVTDGLPALALVTDPPSPDLLTRPPRRPDAAILGGGEWWMIALTAALQAGCVFGVYAWAMPEHGLAEARNLAFSALVFGELFRAFAARSDRLLFWEVGAFTNMKLLGVVAVSALVQLGIHHIPATQQLFDLGTLSLSDCVLTVGVGLIPVSLLELSKLFRRWPGNKR